MTTEAEAGAKLAQQATMLTSEDGREFLVLPQGMVHHDVSDEFGLKVGDPRYIKQAITLQTADSLIDYIEQFKTETSLLLADISANTIVAQLDYHAAGKPGLISHKATLVLPFSEEWALWTGISGKLKPQLEFARFIEENTADIRVPSGGELLEAVRDLQAHRKVNFTKAVRTSSENESFEWTDDTKATSKGDIEIPTKFILGIPVYFGEPETEVHAFLRWKLGNPEEGGLTLGIQVHRQEHVRQAVFKQIVGGVVTSTSLRAVYGKL